MDKKTQGSYEQARRHSLQVVYTRTMEKRRIYMEELRDIRKENNKQVLKKIKASVGPIWYQVLSVQQRNALDELKFGIYKDLLEGRSKRTSNIMRVLGIYPQPEPTDLINCIYAGRNDPKEMLACLFLIYYGHYIHGKRSSYDLNARLMLSGILYLGLDDLIRMLEERFRPETEEKTPPPKPKIKSEPELDSPYLQKMVAAFYEPARLKRQLPLPLPNLDDIDEPYEDVPTIPKPPPPPPPPPPPKKRLPRSYCDKMAEMPKFQPYDFGLPTGLPAHSKKQKSKTQKYVIPIEKKEYGIDTGLRKKANRRKRPSTPNTGIWNAQYMIQGVYNVNDRCVFIIGAVSILPPLGELIHGGFALIKGTYVNIHCGFTARPEPMKPPPCDCKKKYLNSVFRYIQKTQKCIWGHNYDYGNEGTFPTEEVPFFEKPTPTTTFSFNYNKIFEQDPKMIHVAKEFKKVWEADSNLNIDPVALAEKKEKEKKKKKKKDSNTCLGTNPKITDYLKCALRMMRPVNISAKLPDIHLVPELKEWMRYRLYGRFTAEQKKKLLSNSVNIWGFFKSMKTFEHVALPKDPAYLKSTTWKHKTELSKRFKKYVHDYQLAMFKLHAQVNNLMWATMCQTQFPDKNFREIYFSYLVSRMNDVQLMHPYSTRETADRMLVMALRRYNCPPDVEIDEF